MSVIVLRPRSHTRPFLVVGILGAKIPVHSAIDLDCQTSLRGLITHRIGSDQRPRSPGGIRHAVALTVILVQPVGSEKSESRCKSRCCIYEEEIVSRKVEAVSHRMTNTIKKVVDDGITI